MSHKSIFHMKGKLSVTMEQLIYKIQTSNEKNALSVNHYSTHVVFIQIVMFFALGLSLKMSYKAGKAHKGLLVL